MIKRIVILALIFCVLAVNAEAQAIKRVQKKKSDSTKVDKKTADIKEAERKAAIQKQQQQQQQQQAKKAIQRQDEFIDRDGDGINDKVIQAKPPAIKKQQQPKVNTPKAPPVKTQTPAKQKKASTNTSTKKEDKSKKSKR